MFVPLLDLPNAELSLEKYWRGLWSLKVGGGGGVEKGDYSSATLSPQERFLL